MVLSPTKTSISKGKGLVLYAISYIRVSTQRQSELDKSGIRRQLQAYLTWLEQHPERENLEGLVLRDLGVSGRKDNKKGALALFLKKAEKGEIPPNTCLVVESMSRLTRLQPYDGLKLLIKIWDLGYKIAFTQGGWKGEILDGREEGTVAKVAAALEAASYEWEDKRDRVVGWHKETFKMMEQKNYSFFKARKKSSKANYNFWLDFDESTNSFFEIEAKADLVRRIFKMAETMGMKKTAYILKEEGVKNPIGGKSKYLTRAVIEETILRCRAVLGERNHCGVIFKDVYPPIITPEQFDLVQAAIAKRRLNASMAAPNRQVVNLFQGVSFFHHCGGRLVVIRKKRPICQSKYDPNSPKIEVEFQTIQCENAREKLNECPATNSAPYIQEHNDLDNELKILNKIATFRWADFFTDEKHDEELKVLTDKRMRLLTERNEIEQLLDNQTTSRAINYWDKKKMVPEGMDERIENTQKEYDNAESSYKSVVNAIQNLKRKKTGQQLEVDIHKRVKSFIDKGRFIPAKRAEFNIFLKEAGISLEDAIFKKQKGSNAYEENYQFDIGVGMYDFISGKYRGLSQVEDDAVLFGIDLEQVRKYQAKQEESYKKQSIEEGRDVRSPKPKLRFPLTYESELGKEIMANKELLKTAGGKAQVKQMEKNKDLPLANSVPMKLLKKIENKEFLESLTEEELKELKIHKSKKAILEARRQRAKEEKK